MSGRDNGVGLLESLLNDMAAAVLVMETVTGSAGVPEDFILRLCNASCEQVLGRPGRELAGRLIGDGLPELVELGLREHLLGVVETGARLDFDMPVRLAPHDDKGGEGRNTSAPRWLHVSASRVPEGVALIVTDVTVVHQQTEALRAAKQAAEKANAEKAMLLRALSHEVRTPLNTIRGFSEMVASEMHGRCRTPSTRGTWTASTRPPSPCQTWWTACWTSVACRRWGGARAARRT